MPKLTFDEALERINDDRRVRAEDVQAAALRRTIWVAANGSPGCLSDHYSICTSKKDAVDTCVLIADDGEGAPRGLRSALSQSGDHTSFSHHGYLYTVDKRCLADVF